MHVILYGLLAVILAGGLFLVVTQFLPAGEQIAPALRDEPPWDLPPDRNLQADDVDAVRLPVALRGYRFAETDTLLDRLADELRARDQEIARLRGRVPAVPGEVDLVKPTGEPRPPSAASDDALGADAARYGPSRDHAGPAAVDTGGLDLGRLEAGNFEIGRSEIGHHETGREEIGDEEIGDEESGRDETGYHKTGSVETGHDERH